MPEPDIHTAVTPANGTPAIRPPAAQAAEAQAPPADPAAASQAAKEGQMLASLRAREVKLVEQQKADARKRQEFENYQRQTQADIDRARQMLDKAKADPIAVLRDLGWSEEAIAARVMSGGKPTDIEERDALRREIGELRKWRESQEQASQQRQQQQAREQAEAAFAARAKERAGELPLVSRVKEARLKSRGLEIAVEHHRQGIGLTDDEILDKLEEELSDFVPKAAVTEPAIAASQTPTEATSGQATQPAPTLTNRAAGASATAVKPDVLKMSDQERLEYTLSELKRLRAAGQIAD